MHRLGVPIFVAGMFFAYESAVRISLLLLLLITLGARAQESTPNRFFEPYKAGRSLPVDTPLTPASEATGVVTVHSDVKVDRLMERFTATKQPHPGFRVQVYLGNDRKAAEDMKRSFLQKNPESPAYLSWLAPNWRLRVGDLRTRLEAERLLRDLKLAYPGSFIVPDEIEMPR